MNKTQKITVEWLRNSCLEGDELLLESLLRRGFLAFKDEDGIWLGSGSHGMDAAILNSIKGLDVEFDNRPDRIAKISSNRKVDMLRIATAVIAIPEHHVGEACGGFITDSYLETTWKKYCEMKWGFMLPVCPAHFCDQKKVENALDLGIALLVKALPLARVATRLSCDGHGIGPAKIYLHYPWDVYWATAVFSALGIPTPNTKWEWNENELTIKPIGGKYTKTAVLGMLNDIQACARRLLNKNIIEQIGDARSKMLENIGERSDDFAYFSEEAARLLQGSPALKAQH
ncbi:MAG: hypothetical protein WCQ16_04550 [Verrucomicrobiae bacterium]